MEGAAFLAELHYGFGCYQADAGKFLEFFDCGCV